MNTAGRTRSTTTFNFASLVGQAKPIIATPNRQHFGEAPRKSACPPPAKPRESATFGNQRLEQAGNIGAPASMPGKHLIMIGHAALDRIYRVGSFPREPSKVRAIEAIEVGGGMAANAAVAAARLGAKVELWSRVGDDNAAAIIKAGLKAERVDTRGVQSFEEARSSTAAIIVDDRGERLIVSMRDSTMPTSTSWLPLERIPQAAVIVADTRWLEATRTAFEHARKAGVTTLLDADLGAREALPEVLELADYAIFSAPALRELARDGSDMDRLAGIVKRGPRHAGVTLGRDGYLWCEADGTHGSYPAFAVDAVDTTGAGDAFHGAFAVALAEGRPTAECIRRASAVAALKCTRLGSRAGLPTADELDAFLAVRS
jgi:sulfofructose kinase